MHTIHKLEPSAVLMKAFSNACTALNVTCATRSEILGVNASTLSRKNNTGFSPQSKTGELQLHFIRVYRSLYAIAGGDSEFMNHWYKTHNNALNGSPDDLCRSIQGLFRVTQYLDAMRGKI